MRFEKLIQTWLDVDVCDRCGRPIPYGQPIYLDIEKERAGIIPAYCSNCAKMMEGRKNKEEIE